MSRLPSRLTDRDRLTIVMVAAPIVRPRVERLGWCDPENTTANGYYTWWWDVIVPARDAVLRSLALPSRRANEIEEIEGTVLSVAEAIHHEREHMIPADQAGYPTLEGPHGFSVF